MAAGQGGSGSGGEDDSAPLFFLLALLVCFLVPWTLTVLWHLLDPGRAQVANTFPDVLEDGCKVRSCQTEAMASKRKRQIAQFRSRRAAFTRGFTLRAVLLVLLWIWLIYIVVALRKVFSTSSLYANFNPFELLEVSHVASKVDIKKAYRKKSLLWHPDKNQDPEAPERFMLVKKAYDALTDPIAKRNYERYGNPDGPTRVTLGVAIPTFSKEQQTTALLLFLFLFIIGVPLMMLACMGVGEPQVCENGVMRVTMEALANGLGPSTDVRGAQKLLLDCGESRKVCGGEFVRDLAEKEVLMRLSLELRPKAGKSGGPGQEGLMKSDILFQAHVLRLTAELTGGLREDLDAVLPLWRKVTLAMMEHASKQNLGDAAAGILELHRTLVQAVDPGLQPSTNGATALLQVPHLTSERIKEWRKGPRKGADLRTLASMDAEERRKSMEAIGLSAQELLDVEEFARVVPQMSVQEATVFVANEEGICVNDIATLKVRLARGNLSEGEAAGMAHAPLFAGAAVPEAWRLSLTLPGNKARPCWSRLTNPRHEVVAEMRFRVPLVGKNRCKLFVKCEAYAGLDLEQIVTFEARPAEHRDQEGEDSGSGGGD